MRKQSIIAGITDDGQIYIIEAEFKNRRRYFSMSANEVIPVTLEEAKDIARRLWENLFFYEEELEAFEKKMNRDFKDAEEAAEFVLEVDGPLHGFDNSLVPDEIVDYKGHDWLFESGGCGQAIRTDLEHYFIYPDKFSKLIEIWNEYHLEEENPPDFPDIEQDWEEELKKGIDIIRPEAGHLGE